MHLNDCALFDVCIGDEWKKVNTYGIKMQEVSVDGAGNVWVRLYIMITLLKEMIHSCMIPKLLLTNISLTKLYDVMIIVFFLILLRL